MVSDHQITRDHPITRGPRHRALLVFARAGVVVTRLAQLCRAARFASLAWMPLPPPVPEQPSRTIETLYRSESGRVLATLVRLLGDLDLAEEAMHEPISFQDLRNRLVCSFFSSSDNHAYFIFVARQA